MSFNGPVLDEVQTLNSLLAVFFVCWETSHAVAIDRCQIVFSIN